MARTAGPIKNPIFPLNKVIRHFVKQTQTQLEVNAMTQHVFPMEIYNGFAIVNEKRKQMAHGDHNKGWFATGAGAKSFQGKVLSADEAGNTTVMFSFNDYMRFVDMGVGKGTKLEDVENGKKARYTTRYARMWDRASGSSQRPAIMMEMRHLQRRILDYLTDYYGNEYQVEMVNAFNMKAIEILNL